MLKLIRHICFIKCVTQSIPCTICYHRDALVITCIPGATALTYQLYYSTGVSLELATGNGRTC